VFIGGNKTHLDNGQLVLIFQVLVGWEGGLNFLNCQYFPGYFVHHVKMIWVVLSTLSKWVGRVLSP